MHIKPKILPVRLLLGACLTGITVGALGWQADWDLDREMAVLDQPARRPIILPYGDGKLRGSPNSSQAYYKQLRPGEQGDFRNLPSSGAGIPSGGGTPGVPIGGSGGTGGGTNGGGSGGGGANNGNNGQQGPQIDPPDIGGPDIPMDPIPLPPLFPPLF